jgi:hypothetical protein
MQNPEASVKPLGDGELRISQKPGSKGPISIRTPTGALAGALAGRWGRARHRGY